MAGVKKSWKSIIGSIRSALVHKYEGNTCTGAVARIRMVLIVDEGREEGRLIVTDMTIEEARQRVTELQEAIKVAEESDFITI